MRSSNLGVKWFALPALIFLASLTVQVLLKENAPQADAAEDDYDEQSDIRHQIKMQRRAMVKAEKAIEALKEHLAEEPDSKSLADAMAKEKHNSKKAKVAIHQLVLKDNENKNKTGLKLINRKPIRVKHFQNIGLDVSEHPEIVMYRIQWFSGGWSPWYVPGLNDVDWKLNGSRRVWCYFEDHNHEYIVENN